MIRNFLGVHQNLVFGTFPLGQKRGEKDATRQWSPRFRSCCWVTTTVVGALPYSCFQVCMTTLLRKQQFCDNRGLFGVNATECVSSPKSAKLLNFIPDTQWDWYIYLHLANFGGKPR